MIHENTIIPSGCIRDLPAGNKYLFCFRMLSSVRHKMRPEIKSRNESNALVMMDSDPELYAANTLIQSNKRHIKQMEDLTKMIKIDFVYFNYVSKNICENV